MLSTKTLQALYADNAKTIYYTEKRPDGSILQAYDLIYNKNGNLISSTNYKAFQIYTIIYTYDKKSRLIASFQYLNNSHQLEEIIEYDYDKIGKIRYKVERRFKMYDGVTYESIIEHNYVHEGNKEIETITDDEEDKDYSCSGVLTSIYDDYGGILEFNFVNANGEMTLDEQYSNKEEEINIESNKIDSDEVRNQYGHWIKQIRRNGDKISYIDERKIEYHKNDLFQD
jgi:hypothetical protein